MQIFIRRKKSDTWHFMKECTLYPDKDKVDVVIRVTEKTMKGDLCNQCKAKARKKIGTKSDPHPLPNVPLKKFSKGKDEENE